MKLNHKLMTTFVLLGLGLAGAWFVFGDNGRSPGNSPIDAASANSQLVLSPASLDFGELAVGMREERSIIVTNAGDEMLFVTAIEAPEGFTVKPASLELAPGASRAVQVLFAPLAAGMLTDASLVVSPLQQRPQFISLAGQVLASAQIHVQPLSLAFGRVQIGKRAEASVRIENRGEEPLAIKALAVSQPFSVEGGGAKLGPGESTEVRVLFQPDDGGPAEAYLSIKSSDETHKAIVVSLRGNGDIKENAAEVAVSADTLSFGSVPVGHASTRFLELANRGRDPLTITRIATTPPFEATAAGWTIEPGGKYRVGFRFRPQSSGAALGPVTIYSNDPINGALVLSMVGEGIVTSGPGSEVGLVGATNSEGTPPVTRVSDEGAVVAATTALDPSVAGAVTRTDASDPDAAAGEGADAADPDVAAEGDGASDDELGPFVAEISVAEGSVWTLGSQTAVGSNHDVQGLDFDPATGALRVESMSTHIDFALGDFFDFEFAPFEGQVSDIGHFQATTQVTMTDKFGNQYTFDAVISTGELMSVTPDGLVFSTRGQGFTDEAPALNFNVATPRNSPAAGLPFQGLIKLNVPEVSG